MLRIAALLVIAVVAVLAPLALYFSPVRGQRDLLDGTAAGVR